jgi:hypothetical protein
VEAFAMTVIRWFFRMIADIFAFGVVNRSFALSFMLLGLLVIALTIVAAQVAAPFIYTLF